MQHSLNMAIICYFCSVVISLRSASGIPHCSQNISNGSNKLNTL
uniref:Uncharacterized protein n=1 Tax=Anguilla anguilla TaxID=7936 RepID=A0A0E9SEF1_ANGAN